MSASLRMTGGGSSETFTFLTLTTDSGYVLDQEMIEEEVLETAGVDGRRFRTMFKQHSPTPTRTVAAAASFGDAVILANSYRKAKGRIGSLSITAGARSETIVVHVREVDAQPRAGQVVGAAASSGNTAHVLCTWVVEPVEFEPSASA